MKLLILVVCFCFTLVKSDGDGFHSVLSHIKPKTDEETQATAAKNLIIRLMPERASEFNVTVIKNFGPDGKDRFKLEKLGEIIQITASSGVAAAWGFQHYLKYYCNAHISWESVQLSTPTPLPNVNTTITANDLFRYYQNVCTTSYSFVWWSWKDWEKHIDWMAMNGMNLVLAFNGQEAIWKRVYKNFNLTDDDINDYFAGPAFLSWSRMGNFRAWGGPLSDAWHARSLDLQKSILQRMRELGITPVLPAYAGHVPLAFKRLFPNAQMRQMGPWSNFGEQYCCPYLVDPTDPLFKKIGNAFMSEQINEFGTDHIYNCDTFNEMTPPSSDPAYLQQVSKAIYSSMTDIDPKAIWLMQGWLFYNAQGFWTKELVQKFVTAIPLGRMIILDLQSEQFPQYPRLDSYFGQPFIWCMLHDFGGTLGMFGSAERINIEVFKAREFPNGTLIGTGLTPEGINQNYVIYDLMNEQAWRRKSTNLTKWFADYSTRRYGKADENAIAAWQTLKDTVYNFDTINLMRGKYVITRSPRLNINTWFWYNTTDFMNAWDNLLKAADNLEDNAGYKHDLVDVTRQVLQILGDIYYPDMVKAFKKKNIHDFQKLKIFYDELFKDLDLILSSNEAFLLGRWLEAAKSASSTPEDKALFEMNARNQITLWGPHGEIRDYANKQWGGVVSHFFGPRWELFLSAMNDSLVNNQQFNESSVRERVFNEVELPFTFDRTIFPTKVKGDSIEIATEIYGRWRNKIKAPVLKKKRNRLRTRSSNELPDFSSEDVL